MTETATRTCVNCGKIGPIAEDQTDPAWGEMALDTRRVLCPDEYACGECLEAAEDAAYAAR